MYKKSNRYSSKYRRFRPKHKYKYKNKGTNWGSIAKTALKTAKFVAGIVNAEYKYYITGSSLTTTTWNGQVITLFQPIQGVGVTNRVGDSCKLKNMIMRAEFAHNFTSTVKTETARLIIFNDKENIISTAADLLQALGTYQAVYQEKNEDNRYDTKILYDKEFVINDNTFSQRKINVNLKLNWHTHFQAGSTTIKNGALKAVILSQTASLGPQFTHTTRVSFVDN